MTAIKKATATPRIATPASEDVQETKQTKTKQTGKSTEVSAPSTADQADQIETGDSSAPDDALSNFVTSHSGEQPVANTALSLQLEEKAAPQTVPQKLIQGGDIEALATQLFAKTLGRLGTDEAYVFQTLEAAYHGGELESLNAHFGELVKETPEALVEEFPKDCYLRHMIDKELSGSQKKRAYDLLQTGKDSYSASSLSYVTEGILNSFDEIGDSARDNPLLFAAASTGAIGVSLAAPTVAMGVGVAVFVAGLVKTARHAVASMTAKTPKEKSQSLIKSGHGIGNVIVASPTMFSAASTLTAAQAAAGAAPDIASGAQAFLLHGGVLEHSGGVASHLAVGTSEIPEFSIALDGVTSGKKKKQEEEE